jgi:hypothetical protein
VLGPGGLVDPASMLGLPPTTASPSAADFFFRTLPADAAEPVPAVLSAPATLSAPGVPVVPPVPADGDGLTVGEVFGEQRTSFAGAAPFAFPAAPASGLQPVADLFDPGPQLLALPVPPLPERPPAGVVPPLPERAPPVAIPSLPVPPMSALPPFRPSRDGVEPEGFPGLSLSPEATFDRLRQTLLLAPEGSVAHTLTSDTVLTTSDRSKDERRRPAPAPPQGRPGGGGASARANATVAESTSIDFWALDGSAIVNAGLQLGPEGSVGRGRVTATGARQFAATATWLLSPESFAAYQAGGPLPDWARPESLNVGDWANATPIDLAELDLGQANLTEYSGEGAAKLLRRLRIPLLGGRSVRSGPTIGVTRTPEGYTVLAGGLESIRPYAGGNPGLEQAYVEGRWSTDDTTWQGVAVDVGDLSDPAGLGYYAGLLGAGLDGAALYRSLPDKSGYPDALADQLPIAAGSVYSRFHLHNHQVTYGGTYPTAKFPDPTGRMKTTLGGAVGTRGELTLTTTPYRRSEQPGGVDAALGWSESTSRWRRDSIGSAEVSWLDGLVFAYGVGNDEPVQVTVDSHVDVGGGAGATVTVRSPDATYTFAEDDLIARARALVASGDPAAGDPLVQELSRGTGAWYALRNAVDTLQFPSLSDPDPRYSNQELLVAVRALAGAGPAPVVPGPGGGGRRGQAPPLDSGDLFGTQPTAATGDPGWSEPVVDPWTLQPAELPEVQVWEGSAIDDLGLSWAYQADTALTPADYLAPADYYGTDWAGSSWGDADWDSAWEDITLY